MVQVPPPKLLNQWRMDECAGALGQNHGGQALWTVSSDSNAKSHRSLRPQLSPSSSQDRFNGKGYPPAYLPIDLNSSERVHVVSEGESSRNHEC